MEMAISGTASSFSLLRLSKPPSSWFSCHVSPKCIVLKKTQERAMVSMSATSRFGSLKGGTGLLERPSFDQSQFDPTPQAEEGGNVGLGKTKIGVNSGDSYRVLLIDDQRHTEKIVAKVLPQAVPSITPDDARKLFHKSRENGVAVVIVAVKEHAEFYAQMMVRWGLRSAIEPDSSLA
ncbi:ATP-dependent Clp protease adapter protein CLPS2, chloroplastic-like [Tasmannia lanceolata]|uniref:ATP-dependent Clp protease adapter protein CLPS2, chloroplastic-like n=1 Tax=Tasmannia lanceolata TaxID=3420 RepID=UPI0040627E45